MSIFDLAQRGRPQATVIYLTFQLREKGDVGAMWAGIHHFGDDKFVVGFFGKVKTFHEIYAPFTNPAVVPTLTFLAEYGHLLIGLSLISGLLVRVSAPFASVG